MAMLGFSCTSSDTPPRPMRRRRSRLCPPTQVSTPPRGPSLPVCVSTMDTHVMRLLKS